MRPCFLPQNYFSRGLWFTFKSIQVGSGPNWTGMNSSLILNTSTSFPTVFIDRKVGSSTVSQLTSQNSFAREIQQNQWSSETRHCTVSSKDRHSLSSIVPTGKVLEKFQTDKNIYLKFCMHYKHPKPQTSSSNLSFYKYKNNKNNILNLPNTNFHKRITLPQTFQSTVSSYPLKLDW